MDGTGRLPYTTGENESKPLFGFFISRWKRLDVGGGWGEKQSNNRVYRRRSVMMGVSPIYVKRGGSFRGTISPHHDELFFFLFYLVYNFAVQHQGEMEEREGGERVLRRRSD